MERLIDRKEVMANCHRSYFEDIAEKIMPQDTL